MLREVLEMISLVMGEEGLVEYGKGRIRELEKKNLK